MQLRLVLALLFVACLTVLSGHLPCSEAAPTERPYQFGFTIEKQQHRQEKKDERGIVMGEFGFITADGIYHVTVYATDEEGKFRILAMRSYPYEEHPKTIEMIVRPKANPTTPKPKAPLTTDIVLTERPKPKPFEKPNFSVQGCSGCFIKNNVPTTTTTTTRKPEEKKSNIRPLSKSLATEKEPTIGPAPPSSAINSNTAKPSTTDTPAKIDSNALSNSPDAPSAGTTGSTNGFPTPKKQLTAPTITAGNTGGEKGIAAGGGIRPNTKAGVGGGKVGNSNNGVTGKSGGFGSRDGSTGGFSGGSSAGSAIGETGDLYRFKYNLDYNGHRETGARNGNKEGGFYAIGDDNVERTIEYIANEFGYQPRIRFRKLDTPVQAKENTLKDYEFVWFNGS